jgi:ketosteroid isomerase-like protein
MSHENVELVQRGFDYFMATGEPDWGTLDEAIEVHDHDILDAGDYRGHEGFRRWLDDWGTAWAAYSFELEEFIDAGDRIVALLHMKTEGQSSGVETERQDAMVITMRDGKWLRVDYYNNRKQALGAVGLTE